MALTTAEQSGMIHGSDLQYLLNKIKGQFSDKTAYNGVSVDSTTNKFSFTRANGGSTDAITQANATSALSGLMSSTDKGILDNMKSNFDSADSYKLKLAASGTRGGVQVGYEASGKVYAVQLSNEKMYVNVPWENNTWRGITTALNNTSTTVSASASAVKALNDKIVVLQKGQISNWLTYTSTGSFAEVYANNLPTGISLLEVQNNKFSDRPSGGGSWKTICWKESNSFGFLIAFRSEEPAIQLRSLYSNTWSNWVRLGN